MDVAKIEGSQAYKQMMRGANAWETPWDTPLLETPVVASTSGISTAYESLSVVHFFTTLIKLDATLWAPYFPEMLSPWLSRNVKTPTSPLQEPKDARVATLELMIRALVTAVESYLDEKISSADVTTPFTISDDFRAAIHSAASSLSLKVHRSRLAPISATSISGIPSGKCDNWNGTHFNDDRKQLILVIDYSRAALTATLLSEKCNYFKAERLLHDTRFGAERLGECNDACLENFKLEFRRLIRLPLENVPSEFSAEFRSGLLLIGESVPSVILNRMLKDVDGEKPGNLLDASATERPQVKNPTFLAARGAAEQHHELLYYMATDPGSFD